MTIRLLLVDALNLVRRVYAARPGDDSPERADEARLASAQSLQRALRECRPTHTVAVFDGAPPTWRHRLHAAYKAGHKPMPAALADALPAYREAFAALGVRSFELAAMEADDVVATLAAKVSAGGGHATILSTDRVFLQLLGERIGVRNHFDKRDLDRDWVVDRFGVEPGQLIDYFSLVGDSANGIAGVRGVGAKTAARLVAQHGALDSILAAAATGEAMAPRLAAKLLAQEPEARLSRTLMSLRIDLDLGLNLRTLRLGSETQAGH